MTPDRLALAALAHVVGPGEDGLRLAAFGWATVDHERTIADFGELEFATADDDELLGAHAWRASTSSLELLVLEPAIDRHLASALARWGEGLAAIYLVGRDARPGASGQQRGQTALGRPGRLLSGAPGGPFVILLE